MANIPIFRKDFQNLARLRAADAKALLNARRPQGAYYLAGYTIECALKACIAKTARRYQFPPDKSYVDKVYRHSLEELAKVAGLYEDLKKDTGLNPAFAANWNTVKDWTEQSRYKTSGLNGADMYNAVTAPDGVLAWIERRW